MAALLVGWLVSPAHNMVLPDTIAQSLIELAFHVELNKISESETSLSCAAWDCEFKLHYGTFFAGVGMKTKKQCPFLYHFN